MATSLRRWNDEEGQHVRAKGLLVSPMMRHVRINFVIHTNDETPKTWHAHFTGTKLFSILQCWTIQVPGSIGAKGKIEFYSIENQILAVQKINWMKCHKIKLQKLQTQHQHWWLWFENRDRQRRSEGEKRWLLLLGDTQCCCKMCQNGYA